MPVKIYEPYFVETENTIEKHHTGTDMYEQVVDAIALQAVTPDIEGALPSARYLSLLRAGAKEYGVAKEWQDHLNHTLEPFNPVGGMSLKNIGRFSFTLVVLPLFILPMLFMITSHLFKVTPPLFIAKYMKTGSAFIWWVHNTIWSKIFGSGKNNHDLKQVKKE